MKLATVAGKEPLEERFGVRCLKPAYDIPDRKPAGFYEIFKLPIMYRV